MNINQTLKLATRGGAVYTLSVIDHDTGERQILLDQDGKLLVELTSLRHRDIAKALPMPDHHECPDCGKPIERLSTGWWSHVGMYGDCWRLSMDGPNTYECDECGAMMPDFGAGPNHDESCSLYAEVRDKQ